MVIDSNLIYYLSILSPQKFCIPIRSIRSDEVNDKPKPARYIGICIQVKRKHALIIPKLKRKLIMTWKTNEKDQQNILAWTIPTNFVYKGDVHSYLSLESINK